MNIYLLKYNSSIYGVSFPLNTYFILEIISFFLEGLQIFNERMVTKEALEKLSNDDKETKAFISVGNNFFDNQIKPLWRYVLSYVRDYFTLYGRKKRVHYFNYIFLIHFWYCNKISSSYYMLKYLNWSVAKHKKRSFLCHST